LSERDFLLRTLRLPPEASADEIEHAFLRRRAEIEERVEASDPGARRELELLEAVRNRAGVKTELVHERVPTPVREEARPWEGTAALICGALACLLSAVLYLASLSGIEVKVGFPVDNPFFWLVFALALAAETLSHVELQAGKRAKLIAGHGGRPRREPDPARVGRARLGRRLGRIAAAANIAFALFILFSFFQALKCQASSGPC
jgi:hypothetical protein